MGDVGQLPVEVNAIDQDIFCQDCGYNLRSLTGDRCPECGRSLAGLRGSVSQIPWVHRKEIGRFRAYWKTVWFVMFRQRQFCDEMVRPVSYSDSQRFRWLTVAFAFIPIGLLGCLAGYFHTLSPISDELFNAFWTTSGLARCVHIGILLFLAGATGLPSYFFDSRTVETPLRNRTIALSYYACGPLSLLFLPATAIGVIVADPRAKADASLLAALLAIILPIALFGIWWVDLDHLSARLMPDRRPRTITMALSVPILWLLLFGLTVIVFPLLVLYVALIFSSIV